MLIVALSCCAALDHDGDGVPSELDCDDSDPQIFPGAVERCDSPSDDDCSGSPWPCRLTGSWDVGDLARAVRHPEGGSGFGTAMVRDGDELLVGAPGGPGALFRIDRVRLRDGGSTEGAWVVAGSGSDGLGAAVSTVGGAIVVGAPGSGALDPAEESTGLAAGAIFILGPDVASGAEIGTVANARIDGPSPPACLGTMLLARSDGALIAGAPCLGARMLHHPSLDLPMRVHGRGAVFVLPATEEGGAVGALASQSWEGDGEWDQLGAALAAGDWDGDGETDLALGAPDYYGGDWVNALATGRVHLKFGPDFDRNAELVGGCCGRGRHDELGSALSSGDVDGNGIDDLLAGVPALVDFERQGGAFLLRGPLEGEQAAFDGEVAYAGAPQEPLAARSGEGVLLVDVDCDGQLDAVVGAPWTDGRAGATQAGAVYVSYGPWDPWEPLGEADLLITGTEAWGGLGTTLLEGPDTGGDGCEDLVLGAPGVGVVWVVGVVARSEM